MDAFELSCRNIEEPLQPTEVAFTAFDFVVWVGFSVETEFTQEVLFLPGIGEGKVIPGGIANVAGAVKSDVALLAVREGVVLFVEGAAATDAGRVEHIFTFASFFIFFLFHKLFKLLLVFDGCLGWTVAVFDEFVIFEEVEVVYFFVFECIHD
jgi:hypothetical protein